MLLDSYIIESENLSLPVCLGSGGLIFYIVQRLPSGKPGTAPKEWD